jgi:hypothetical protein
MLEVAWHSPSAVVRPIPQQHKQAAHARVAARCACEAAAATQEQPAPSTLSAGGGGVQRHRGRPATVCMHAGAGGGGRAVGGRCGIQRRRRHQPASRQGIAHQPPDPHHARHTTLPDAACTACAVRATACTGPRNDGLTIISTATGNPPVTRERHRNERAHHRYRLLTWNPHGARRARLPHGVRRAHPPGSGGTNRCSVQVQRSCSCAVAAHG